MLNPNIAILKLFSLIINSLCFFLSAYDQYQPRNPISSTLRSQGQFCR